MIITGGHFTSGIKITRYVTPNVSDIVTANLFANYDADTGISGDTFLDSSGNNRNATLYNSPANVTINGTTVLQLTSASSQFVGDTNGYGTALDSAFTFDVWCYPTAASTAGTLISEWGNGTWDSGWQDNQMGFTNVDIRAGVYPTGPAIAKATWTANTWYNIVMVYDGTQLKTYVNNLAGGIVDGAKGSPGGTFLSLGLPNTDYLGGVVGYFDGYIGAWKIYDRALTDVEVAQNYNVLLPRYTAAPDGLTSAGASTSAWQIKQDYPSSTDGLYWIRNDNINGGNPVQIYADMTTLGGGWTLLVQNVNVNGWDYATTLQLNTTTPPNTLATYSGSKDPSINYSVLGWADYIKKTASAGQATFDFMFDASYRGRNGAAYTANEDYSFVESYNSQTMGDPSLTNDGWRKNITEIQHFPAGAPGDSATWAYDQDSVEGRMPWYSYKDGSYQDNQAILTTDGYNNGWWGTIIATAYFDPAPWMGGGVSGSVSIDTANPSIIWYWVR